MKIMIIIIFFIFLVMEHRWNEIDRGKPKNSEKTCPSATLSTTNPTWTDPGSSPGLHGGRPAANSLSHGKGQNAVWNIECEFNMSHIRALYHTKTKITN
jgi:hypothetical protein